MRTIVDSVRLAGRRLVAAPLFSLSVLVTLSVAFAVTLSVFTVFDTVLLKPLPYPRASNIVLLRHSGPGMDPLKANQAEATYLYYRQQSSVFDAVGAYLQNSVTLTGDGDAQTLRIAMVTPSLLVALGATPQVGRLFTPAEGQRDAERVVLLSSELWRSRYGADPAIVGSLVLLNQRPCLVVGILPDSFSFPSPDVQLWYNLPIDSALPSMTPSSLEVVARIRPEITVEAAARALSRSFDELRDRYPSAGWITDSGDVRLNLLPLRDYLAGDLRGALRLLMAVALVAFVLALATVLNLSLSRAERRSQEVAVRRALGGASWRLVCLFGFEMCWLVVPAMAIAIAVVSAGTSVRFGLEQHQAPHFPEMVMSGTLWAAAVSIALMTIAILTSASLWRTMDATVAESLRAGRRQSGRTTTLQASLVSVQLAITLALVVGAALCVRSVLAIRRLEYGFDFTQVFAVSTTLSRRGHPAYEDVARFVAALEAKAKTIPGVDGVAVTSVLPLTAPTASALRIFYPALQGAGELVNRSLNTIVMVSPSYFATLRVPVLAGRGFQASDGSRREPPAVLSAEAARRLFGERDAVGKRVRLEDSARGWMFEVVGVVGDVQSEEIGEPLSAVYLPIVETASGESSSGMAPRHPILLMRSRRAPSDLLAEIRNVVRSVDADVPLGGAVTLVGQRARATAELRFITSFMTAAGAASLFLGLLGVYAVVAYTVAVRRHELGVRLVLGAAPAGIVREIVKATGLAIGVGLGVGVLGVVIAVRLLETTLLAVDARDPVLVVAVSAAVALVAVAAAYVPARRATSIEPAEVLSGS